MTELPIDSRLPEIVSRLRDRRSLVLVAPPGAGKTTRVPPAIVRAGLLSGDHPALVMLQPRRVAARASAQRIADENGWGLGEEVGYQIRLERRIGPRTRLRVVTEGILTRQLMADPFLVGVGAVVLDEFHERSLNTDFALALLHEVQRSVRDDLRIVVMSATMDAAPVARFLDDAPIVTVEGRTYPITISYRPAVRPASAEAVRGAVEEALTPDSGDLLVFLPGAEEIRRAGAGLAPVAEREDLVVLPLHGSLTGDDQDRALRPSPRRKVILATNIAETSLTIDGVSTVIDSGLARVASYDPARGLDRLELQRISRASAAQRAGRAGRTGPGRCVRLWSEREQRGLIEAESPEVERVDLAATVLALHAWGQAEPGAFGWFESPPAERLSAAETLLVMLGALTAEGGPITALGRDLLDLPIHPRVGRLLLAASADGHPREGAALAALLSEKDILAPNYTRDARGRGSSDILVRLDLLHEAERSRFSPGLRDRGVDVAAARRVAKIRDDLLRLARQGVRQGTTAEPDEETMLRWLLLAYPDRVTRRRGGEATGVMVGGRGVRLAPESVVRDAELFLSLDPRQDRRGGTLEARVRIASAVRAEWLEECFPESLRREKTVRYHEGRGKVEVVITLCYRDLPLREDRHAAVDPVDAGDALAEALRPRARELFEADEAAAAWLGRLEFLRRAQPERDWPELDDDALGAVLSDVCAGKRSAEEVRREPLVPALRNRLGYEKSRLLDELAPESLTVPSGSRIRLTYERARPPVLAVRLQELFGWTDTPRVAGGRVPVVLHLLGPNYRPVQVTEDLRSFWSNTYFQVRKDLRARYPRHSWPDDPLTAKPEAKGGRRRVE
ncbi:MAG: ATP-dependent helicase HrpB [Isosphaeraceae bacterium]|nr:ATP-dependent helicase HrpB [Isosphaeraceae bacterium]